MGSLLAEILSSVEKMEIHQVNEQCPAFASNVATCRMQVLSFLENIYVRMAEEPCQKITYLEQKIKNLQEDATRLRVSIESLIRSEKTEAKTHLEVLVRTEKTLEVVVALFEIHVGLVRVQELEREGTFPECMRKIVEVEDMFKKCELDFEDNSELREGLMVSIANRKGNFLIKMSRLFEEHVTLKQEKKKSVFQIKQCQLEKLTSTLFSTERIKCLVDKVTHFLWKSVFVPIIESQTVTTTDFSSVLEVVKVDGDHKPEYNEVFSSIKKVLEFLSTSFNFQMDEELNTLNYIGRNIRDPLFELLIKKCLQNTIPSNNEGLQSYSCVIKATEDLEHALVEAQIVAEAPTPISTYAHNVKMNFFAKKCQDSVRASYEFMKKPLDDFVKTDKQRGLAEDNFPICAISQSVVDLLHFLDTMLQDLPTLPDDCKRRLFCTVKIICRKYIIFVPEHHKKLLQTLPEQIALFYNNYMYMASTLSNWNNTHLMTLPSDLNLPNNFGEEGRQLHEVATRKFAAFVEARIREIRGLFDVEVTERVVHLFKQLLKELRASWDFVLPEELASKTLGVILDSCLDVFRSKKLGLATDLQELKNEETLEKWRIIDGFLNNLLDKL